MKKYNYTENELENLMLNKLQKLGYDYFDKQEIMIMRDNDISNVFLWEHITKSLKKINQGISDDEVNKIIGKIRNIDNSNLFEANKIATSYVLHGVKIKDIKTKITKTLRLVDFEKISNNTFIVTNQFSASSYGSDYKKQIPDVVVLINGFPMFVFELKSSQIDYYNSLKNAHAQIKNYQNNLKNIFVFNMFNVISNGNAFKVGTLSSDFSRYNHWRQIHNDNIDYKTDPIMSLFDKKRLLNIIKNYVHYIDSNIPVKIMPGYHQYFGVERAKKLAVKAIDSDDKKIGIFWHTQGSGKSYSMVFLTKNVLVEKSQITTLIITDRNNLDVQLYSTFSNSAKYLNQQITQINNRKELVEKLKKKQQNGIFFCTIQKFSEEAKMLSTRDDILIITDEAHRSQKNIFSKQVLSNNEIIEKNGYGYHLRKALPNASMIGFTGTPIESDDHETKDIFGDYVSKYLMNNATKDGVIVPINYESRKLQMKLSVKMIDSMDNEYDRVRAKIAKNSKIPDVVLKNLNKQIQKLEHIICDPDRITSVAKDFVEHYNNRKNVLKGKAMFVAYNRKIAFEYYQKILEIDPSLKNNVRLIATPNNKVDSIELKELIKDSNYRKKSAIEFKKPSSDFKIAIVVNMWLTGFDSPSLDVLYIDKPIKMHNLMQTIARVNRIYEDSENSELKKETGLIVDYIGIYKRLIQALKFYTKGENLNKKVDDWKNVSDIYENLQKHIQNIKKMWFSSLDFDLTNIIETNDRNSMYKQVLQVQKIMFANSKNIETFINLVKPIPKLLNACLSLVDEKTKLVSQIFVYAKSEIIKKELGEIEIENDIEKIKKIMAETIKFNKTIVQKTHNNKKISLTNIIDLISKESQNIFEDETAIALKSKNAVNAVKELIKRVFEINKIRSGKLSDKLNILLQKYEENIVTIKEFFNGLLSMAADAENAFKDNARLGLSWIEMAFFEILNSKKYRDNDYNENKVKEVTRELFQKVKSKIDTDWFDNDSQKRLVRKEMKDILIKKNYPPNVRKEVVDKIVGQINVEIYEHFIKKGAKDVENE